LVRHVLNCTNIRFKYGRVHIWWYGDHDLNSIGDRLRLELGFGFDQVFDLGASKVLNNTVSPNEGLYMRVNSVRHQIKFTVWRNERDASFAFELIQADALMELNVLHFNQFTARRAALLFKEILIVEA